MAACDDGYLQLDKAAFYEHISDEVSNVAFKVRYHIEDQIREDARAYADGHPNEEARKAWMKHLGIDIASVNYEDDSINGVISQPILDYVLEKLQPLKDRAETLPKPSDAQALMDAIKEKLYGPGHAGDEPDARGPLGTAASTAADVRTNEDRLLHWTSTAADNFKDGVLENTESAVIPFQRDELNTLAHLADLNYGAVLTAREDICQIAHAASAAADDMVEGCSDGANGDEPTVAAYLGMASAAMAIGAACVASAGGALPVALGVGSGVASGAAAGAPFFEEQGGPKAGDDATKEERSFGAADWKELIDKIADAAVEMEADLDASYRNIGEAAARCLEGDSWQDREARLVAGVSD